MSATRHRTFISPNSTGGHAWATGSGSGSGTGSGSGSPLDAYRRPSEPQSAAQASPTAEMAARSPHPFPTVDVPDHAHYTIGSVILAVGITGMVGNFLVIYAFSRSRSLRTPANMFIINLAVTDLLMCVTQAPVFFVSSMHKRWIFGERACELYAFCGALFGICSMVTLTVIAVDRYVVITRPLTSIGVLSRKRALVVLAAAWTYSLGWSLPPFFGWSAYVPEGLLTSCTWDYVTFTPSVRAYTMLLFVFVFFVPLLVIVCCYVSIFRAVRRTDRAVGKMSGTGVKTFHRLQNEWKMAKIALIVILLYVVSWAPYSTVALAAFAGYADMLTPYMNSVPAVIAKASAIHNPVIYAITHPKYRVALAKYIPCLGALLCVRPTDLRSAGGSFASTRRSTVTSQSSDISAHFRRHGKSRLSSVSDSESGQPRHPAEETQFGRSQFGLTTSAAFRNLWMKSSLTTSATSTPAGDRRPRFRVPGLCSSHSPNSPLFQYVCFCLSRTGFNGHGGGPAQSELSSRQPPGVRRHRRGHGRIPRIQTVVQLQGKDEESRLGNLREDVF
ncbi:melanopsin-A-like isoform X3 [Phycodurus eques]|nr:melanopsin-A-like isoform X3 [Phycodurus eques]XP_061546469.1 melanopsin-A-like isoform X3 [Phycodurus eques]